MVTNNPLCLKIINKRGLRVFTPFIIKKSFCDHFKPCTSYQFYDWTYVPDRPKLADLIIFEDKLYFYRDNLIFDQCTLYEELKDAEMGKGGMMVRQKDIIPYDMT